MKHYAIFEVNHNTKKTKLVDAYKNQEDAEMICESMNNFRDPSWPIHYITRAMEQIEWENKEKYCPWITGITAIYTEIKK